MKTVTVTIFCTHYSFVKILSYILVQYVYTLLLCNIIVTWQVVWYKLSGESVHQFRIKTDFMLDIWHV